MLLTAIIFLTVFCFFLYIICLGVMATKNTIKQHNAEKNDLRTCHAKVLSSSDVYFKKTKIGVHYFVEMDDGQRIRLYYEGRDIIMPGDVGTVNYIYLGKDSYKLIEFLRDR